MTVSHRSIPVCYRQPSFWGRWISNCRYRIVLPEDLMLLSPKPRAIYKTPLSPTQNTSRILYQNQKHEKSTEVYQNRGFRIFFRIFRLDKLKSAKERKRVQKKGKERKRVQQRAQKGATKSAKERKNRKPPGLKQPGLRFV